MSTRFLVVGLGSMGKRRIRNLRHLNAGEIIGFDPRADRRAEAEDKYQVRTFGDFASAMAAEPHALVISTPPDRHLPYASAAVQAGKHFFTEASVLDDGLEELDARARAAGVVAAPSCTLRFHPSVRLLKQLVESGTVGNIAGFSYHSGQYLPDWHPWEDIGEYYVSCRATGGCREIVPFELSWLTWVLGDVSRVEGLRGKRSHLQADIDDIYQLLLEFRSGVLGHLLVDVVSRVPHRVFRLVGDEGVIEWNASDRSVRVYTAGDSTWQNYPEPEGIRVDGYISAEDMYIDEMAAFVAAIRGERAFPYSLADDRRVLGLLYAAERSADHVGRLVV